MKNSKDIKKIIEKLKKDKQLNIIKKSMPITSPYPERDMRKESMDMGAHGAQEYFGGGPA